MAHFDLLLKDGIVLTPSGHQSVDAGVLNGETPSSSAAPREGR
jgi:hypothetical protein